MANSYITLRSSNSGVNAKFRVIYEGYKRILSKDAQMQKTVNGGLDVAQGGIYERHEYTIRVRHTENDPGYGSLADLEALYRLNNPNGAATSTITFIDHHGVSHSVFMLGDFSENTLGCEIDGQDAWFLVQVTLQVIP